MRYADVLLFKVEALIELDRFSEALPIINLLRRRAANSTARLKFADNSPLANYRVEEYVDGQNIVWNKENARKAFRFERRLELALESSRFFDLVRWGIASEALTQFYELERVRMPNLYDMATQFTKNKHEYLPIPQAQINWSKGLYIQNKNYQ